MNHKLLKFITLILFVSGGLSNVNEQQQEWNAYISFESKIQGYLAGANYSRSTAHLMSIPQTAIDNSQQGGVKTLKQNPGY